MATDTMTTDKTDLKLIAHLTRRAGFGADRTRLERYAENGYEAAVDELLNAPDRSEMPDDLIRRYHHEQSATKKWYMWRAMNRAVASWRQMISTISSPPNAPRSPRNSFSPPSWSPSSNRKRQASLP